MKQKLLTLLLLPLLAVAAMQTATAQSVTPNNNGEWNFTMPDYDVSIETETYEIQDVSFTLSETTFDYDGTDKKPSVTATLKLASGDEMTFDKDHCTATYPDDVKNPGKKSISVVELWDADGGYAKITLTEPLTYNINGPYAVISSNGDGTNTLTFKCGELPDDALLLNGEYESATWGGYSSISIVVFDESFAEARPTSCSNWFSGLYNLESIEGLENFNTSSVTLMDNMFSGCSKLTALDLRHFDTKNVVVMDGMFESCSNLTTILVSEYNDAEGTGWSMQKVTSYDNLFGYGGCKKLIGDKSTTYNEDNYTDWYDYQMNQLYYEYARIDDPENGKPGFLTKDSYKIFYDIDDDGEIDDIDDPSFISSFSPNNDEFTLPQPESTTEGTVFIGWIEKKETGISEPTKDVVIPANSQGNRIYTAIFAPANPVILPNNTEFYEEEGKTPATAYAVGQTVKFKAKDGYIITSVSECEVEFKEEKASLELIPSDTDNDGIFSFEMPELPNSAKLIVNATVAKIIPQETIESLIFKSKPYDCNEYALSTDGRELDGESNDSYIEFTEGNETIRVYVKAEYIRDDDGNFTGIEVSILENDDEIPRIYRIADGEKMPAEDNFYLDFDNFTISQTDNNEIKIEPFVLTPEIFNPSFADLQSDGVSFAYTRAFNGTTKMDFSYEDDFPIFSFIIGEEDMPETCSGLEGANYIYPTILSADFIDADGVPVSKVGKNYGAEIEVKVDGPFVFEGNQNTTILQFDADDVEGEITPFDPIPAGIGAKIHITALDGIADITGSANDGNIKITKETVDNKPIYYLVTTSEATDATDAHTLSVMHGETGSEQEVGTIDVTVKNYAADIKPYVQSLNISASNEDATGYDVYIDDSKLTEDYTVEDEGEVSFTYSLKHPSNGDILHSTSHTVVIDNTKPTITVAYLADPNDAALTEIACGSEIVTDENSDVNIMAEDVYPEGVTVNSGVATIQWTSPLSATSQTIEGTELSISAAVSETDAPTTWNITVTDKAENETTCSFDVTAKAVHTVTFDAKGHCNNPASVKVFDGDKVSDPGSLSDDGYQFAGWFYTIDTEEREWNFSSDPVEGNMTLNAKWLKIISIDEIKEQISKTKPYDCEVYAYNTNGTKLDGGDNSYIEIENAKIKVSASYCIDNYIDYGQYNGNPTPNAEGILVVINAIEGDYAIDGLEKFDDGRKFFYFAVSKDENEGIKPFELRLSDFNPEYSFITDVAHYQFTTTKGYDGTSNMEYECHPTTYNDFKYTFEYYPATCIGEKAIYFEVTKAMFIDKNENEVSDAGTGYGIGIEVEMTNKNNNFVFKENGGNKTILNYNHGEINGEITCISDFSPKNDEVTTAEQFIAANVLATKNHDGYSTVLFDGSAESGTYTYTSENYDGILSGESVDAIITGKYMSDKGGVPEATAKPGNGYAMMFDIELQNRNYCFDPNANFPQLTNFTLLDEMENDYGAILAKVKFDANGFDGTVPETQYVAVGNYVNEPEEPLSKEGYIFDGWWCNGAPWNFNYDDVKDNMTLTAQGRKIIKCEDIEKLISTSKKFDCQTVAYSKDGNTILDGSNNSYLIYHDEEIDQDVKIWTKAEFIDADGIVSSEPNKVTGIRVDIQGIEGGGYAVECLTDDIQFFTVQQTSANEVGIKPYETNVLNFNPSSNDILWSLITSKEYDGTSTMELSNDDNTTFECTLSDIPESCRETASEIVLVDIESADFIDANGNKVSDAGTGYGAEITAKLNSYEFTFANGVTNKTITLPGSEVDGEITKREIDLDEIEFTFDDFKDYVSAEKQYDETPDVDIKNATFNINGITTDGNTEQVPMEITEAYFTKNDELISSVGEGYGIDVHVYMPENENYELNIGSGTQIISFSGEEANGKITPANTVTFHYNVGTESYELTNVITNTKIDDDIPYVEGDECYSLEGWYTDNNTFQNKWNFDEDMVTDDLDLYAKWTRDQYNVTISDNLKFVSPTTATGTDAWIDCGTEVTFQPADDNSVITGFTYIFPEEWEPTKNNDGSYTFTVFPSSDGIVIEAITKKKVELTAAINGWKYGEEPNTPTIKKDGTEISAEKVEIAYTDANENGVAISNTTPVGTYTLTATYPENETELSAEATVTFTIERGDRQSPSELREEYSYTDETICGMNDGSITSATPGMEYRPVPETSASVPYISIDESGAQDLAAGKYEVRFAESDNYNASEPVTVTIAAGRKLAVKFVSDETELTTLGQEVCYKDLVNEPSNVTKEGYTLADWRKSDSHAWNFEEDEVYDDLTLTANWSVNKHNIVYVVDNAEYQKVENVAFGTEITAIAEPTKEGHTFSGWDNVPATMPDNDVTISGSFSINKHNVAYKVDGEVAKTFADVEYGAEIPEYTPENKEGYTFSGWDNVPATMPDNDVTISGTFNINKHDVAYKVDGEVAKTFADVEYGAQIPEYTPENKEGYTFSGWDNVPATMPDEDVTISGTFSINKYDITFVVDGTSTVQKLEYGATPSYGSTEPRKAATAEFTYIFSGWTPEIATVTDDATYTAQFTVTKNKYAITYMVDGAEYQKVQDVEFGSEIQLINAPTKTGYTFDGWGQHPDIMPASDLTINGTFSINKHKITYLVDNEEYQKVENVEFGSAITPIAAPTKEGYTFTNWRDVPATMPDEDVVISGSFSINSYTLTYKVDGEVYGDVETVEYGKALTLRDVPTKEGYTFSGWSELPATMPANDVEVTGSFNTKNKYTITYVVDNEEYQKVENVEFGSVIEEIAAPTKTGYTFNGWGQHPDIMPASDLTINGTFTVNKHKITYLVDGNEIQVVENVEFGSAITPIAAPTKEGFTFTGWRDVPATMPDEDVVISGSFSYDAIVISAVNTDSDGTIIADASNEFFCDGKAVIDFTVKIGSPKMYAITFDNEKLTNQNGELNGNRIVINLPNDITPGTYTGHLALTDNEGRSSGQLPFKMTITILHYSIVTIYNDVAAVNELVGNFIGCQWTKDGKEISGETSNTFQQQFDKKSKYTAILTFEDGSKYETCPLDLSRIVSTKATTLNVYPNPAQPYNDVTVEVTNNFLPNADKQMYIYNLNGTLVKKVTNPEEVNKVQLPSGNYSGVYMQNGEKVSFKLIVK